MFAEYWSGALVQEPQTKKTIENIMNNRESPAIMDLNKVFDEAAVNTSQVIDFSSVMPETNRFSASSNGVNALTNISLGTNSIGICHFLAVDLYCLEATPPLIPLSLP